LRFGFFFFFELVLVAFLGAGFPAEAPPGLEELCANSPLRASLRGYSAPAG
jgi:hypothetical protein